VLRARQVELELPQNIEWVTQTTPFLGEAAHAAGLVVHEYPLLVFKGERVSVAAPPGVEIRQVSGDDEDFARAHAVANVGFSVPGTAVGREGATERDERAGSMTPEVLEFMRARARGNLSVTYAAFDETGPISVGTHQPVRGVSEIVGVATLPSARRRGIAAALTARLLEDALERGVQLVFMGADSADVARIYERAGFEQIGTSASAEPPG
jgi:ribosomal protein S18 acetylase RimI-like enzyme